MGNMDVRIDDDVSIPAGELTWTFSTSGGPGGQHANRAATRAEVRFDVAASSSLPERYRSRILAAMDGTVAIAGADDSRSQWRNRQLARRRLEDMLREAMKPPPPPRRPTKPSRSARRRRLDEKRRRSEVKRNRQAPPWD